MHLATPLDTESAAVSEVCLGSEGAEADGEDDW
ncbi:hypothetical protein MycrhDRAFT_0413 [Mycolicibacterium rhodesiae JS60]|nr:hypothetical protein MycrhDRAFT_0413 [Mycolicibacterium rhodesiae JS60]